MTRRSLGALIDPQTRNVPIRARRCSSWVVGAVSVFLIGAIAPTPQVGPAAVPETAALNIGTDAGAGVAKAGTLCLPSGRLYVSDFIADDDDFKNQVRQALEKANGELQTGLSTPRRVLKVFLEGIQASLCARKYGMFGMGDRRSMSGSADFRFAWSAQPEGSAVVTHFETIHVDVRKKDARPAAQFLTDALTILARRIVAVETGR